MRRQARLLRLVCLRMLGTMGFKGWQKAGWQGRYCVVVLFLTIASGATGRAAGQSCTTQARMTADQRTELGQVAYALATAVAAGDIAKVRAGSVAQYAGDPNQTAALVQRIAVMTRGDEMTVTQAYLLDNSVKPAPEGGAAEFSCALNGPAAETDFTITGLPRGRFAFVAVEARGPKPWVLPFLLEQENSVWKMAGFYPHARMAAGHDGLWYWTTARADAKANKPWLAWVLYGEADDLLRPAAFVSSGNLDRLLGEQRAAAPQALSNGLSVTTPLTVEGTGGAVYRITELGAQGAEDGSVLRLTMHRQQAGPVVSNDAEAEQSLSAARALLTAHPELQEGFADVLVAADGSGGASFVVQRPMAQLMAAGSRIP